MMDVKYGVVEEIYHCEDTERVSYGIVSYGTGDDSSTLIASVHDVSTNVKKLTALVKKCNRLALSPEHLQDVVADFITESVLV